MTALTREDKLPSSMFFIALSEAGWRLKGVHWLEKQERRDLY